MATTLYTTGTISFVNGSTAIVGSGTAFTALTDGDPIRAPDGAWYEIAIDDDTHADLNTAYAGANAPGAAGGTDWVIFKTSISRDSTRTASKQLADIALLYRNIVNLTNADQTLKLNKAGSTDRAGLALQKGGVDLWQAGTFADDEFSLRYLVASTWTKALGVDPATGGASFYSQILFGNVITPPTITATTSDYAPTGIDKANVLRLSSNSDWAFTGLTGGVDGRVVAILNVGDQQFDLEHDGGISAPENRFDLTGDIAIPPNGSALVIYDGQSQRWRQLGGSGSGTGGAAGNKGWSPILAYVSNGSGGTVAQITNWVGGEGAWSRRRQRASALLAPRATRSSFAST